MSIYVFPFLPSIQPIIRSTISIYIYIYMYVCFSTHISEFHPHANNMCTVCDRPGKTLLSGVFPNTDQFGNRMLGLRGQRAGNLVCGGWRAAFESWCGDWKERALSHQFIKRNYQSMRVCDQCDAIKPFQNTRAELLELIFTDFRLDAPWTRTLRSHQAYLDSTPPEQVTPWVEVPGFLITRVRWDSAHTILLGTGKDVAASFLFDMDLWFRIGIFRHFLGSWICNMLLLVAIFVFNKDQKKQTQFFNTFKPIA